MWALLGMAVMAVAEDGMAVVVGEEQVVGHGIGWISPRCGAGAGSAAAHS